MPANIRSTDEDALRKDARALHEALSRLVRVYQSRDRDRICCHDVSVTQCFALEVLLEQGALRSNALAQALKLDKSTTSRVVDALVRKGYVEKTTDIDDARALSLQVTDKGRALHQRISADLIDQQAQLIRGLDAQVRAGATEIIWRLAKAAETGFATDSGLASCASACVDASMKQSRS